MTPITRRLPCNRSTATALAGAKCKAPNINPPSEMPSDKIHRIGLWSLIRQAKGIINAQELLRRNQPIYSPAHEAPSLSSLVKTSAYRMLSGSAVNFSELRQCIESICEKTGFNSRTTLKSALSDIPESCLLNGKDTAIAAWTINRSTPLDAKAADILESVLCPRRMRSHATNEATIESKSPYSTLEKGERCDCCGRFIGKIINGGNMEGNLFFLFGRHICRSKKCRAVAAYFPEKRNPSKKPLCQLAIEELAKNANSENKRRLAKHFI